LQKYARKTVLRKPPGTATKCFNPQMHATVRFLISCLLVTLAVSVLAQQDPAPVKKAIENWLKIQTKGLPGQVSYEIGTVDPGNQLIPCTNFDISRQAGARPWGRTNVAVRCLDEAGWRIYVQVNIHVKTAYLISARPVAQGQTLSAEDISSQLGDLSELPANIITDQALAVGKVASAAIPAGQLLRADMLKALTSVRQGQSVKVVSRGPGFAVANEGKALNNAVEGQVVQVRLADGQVVSGIAKAGGTVEINF
jgi:flagellar basal body P-ring formation protein FlgA